MIPLSPERAKVSAGGWRRAAGPLRALGLLLATWLLLSRVLAPGALPYGGDTFGHDYPIHFWAWNEVRQSGSLPLWIPGLQNGLPTLGSFAWCPLSPTAWMMAISTPGGFRLQWWFALLIAGFGAALWGRAAGLGPAARWIAALAFALSGHLVTLISPGHLQKALALAWAPWALAAVEWGLRGSGAAAPAEGRLAGARRAALGGFGAGAALGMQLLASHIQIAWLTAALAASRALWILAARLLAPAPGERRAAAAPEAALFALGVALAAPLAGGAQWLPGAEMARLSNRAGGVALEEAVETSYPPLELLEYIFPRLFGDTAPAGWGFYSGAWGERLVTDYMGAGAALLALAGLFFASRRRGLRGWLAAALGASLLLALGRYTPAYEWAWRWIPGFSRFRSPGTQMAVAAFALAGLAGLGAESLGALARRGAAARWWQVAAALAAALLLLGGALRAETRSLEARLEPLRGPESLPAESLRRVILLDSVSGTLLWGGGFAAALALALAFAPRCEPKAPREEDGAPQNPASSARAFWREALWIAPAAILALDLITRLQPFLRPEPYEPYLAYLTAAPQDLAILKDPALSPPPRLIERGNELTVRPLSHGIDVPFGYHPVSFEWTHETMRALGLESGALRAIWAVAYVRAPGARPPDDSTTWTALLRGPGWTLWRDTAAPPFARIANSAKVMREPWTPVFTTWMETNATAAGFARPAILASQEAFKIQDWMRENALNPRDLPEIDWDAGPVTSGTMVITDWLQAIEVHEAQRKAAALAPPPAPPPPALAARLESREPDAFVIRVERAAGIPDRNSANGESAAERPAWLVLSTPPAPGWRAFAEREKPRRPAPAAPASSDSLAGEAEPLPLWRADGCATLIPWPGGAGRLILLYRPWSVRLGFFLTLLAFFAAAALGAAALSLRRRRPRASG